MARGARLFWGKFWIRDEIKKRDLVSVNETKERGLTVKKYIRILR